MSERQRRETDVCRGKIGIYIHTYREREESNYRAYVCACITAYR